MSEISHMKSFGFEAEVNDDGNLVISQDTDPAEPTDMVIISRDEALVLARWINKELAEG